MKRLVIKGATILLATALSLAAATPETLITISVLNSFDKPVSNAEVILDFLGSHQITKLGRRRLTHWEVRSDGQGKAKFPPVPQGTIQVQVVAKEYQTFGKKFDIDEAQKTIDVKLNPPQTQYSAHPPLKPPDEPKP